MSHGTHTYMEHIFRKCSIYVCVPWLIFRKLSTQAHHSRDFRLLARAPFCQKDALPRWVCVRRQQGARWGSTSQDRFAMCHGTQTLYSAPQWAASRLESASLLGAVRRGAGSAATLKTMLLRPFGLPVDVIYRTQCAHVWCDSFWMAFWRVEHKSFICWAVTCSYVWYDSCTCATWLLLDGLLARVSWRIHTCDVTHSYVWHDLFWMTSPHVCHAFRI